MYHVTTVTLERAPVFAQPEFASVALEIMREHRTKFQYRIYAFALMPDHWHLLLNPSGSSRSVTELVGGLKSLTTRSMWKLGWEGKVWQERFHDHILRDTDDPTTIATYILENPIRAGLSTNDKPYPFCGTLDPLPRS